MKKMLRFILLPIVWAVITCPAFAQFQYISPKPGSERHNKETNIILKNGSYIDRSSLNPSLVSIVGSVSGIHTAKVVLSVDKKTILINAQPILADGETVTVTVADGFRKFDGTIITGTTFSFSTHPAWTD